MQYIIAILVPTDAESEQKHEAYVAAAARADAALEYTSVELASLASFLHRRV